jgi:branched-chain amino acid transport system permease protein
VPSDPTTSRRFRLVAKRSYKALPLAAVVAVVVALPYMFHGPFVLGQLETVAVLIMVAVGLNFLIGDAGQLSLGPGAVFGISAYAAVVLVNKYPTSIDIWLMCLIGIAAAVVVGFAVGLPALRVGGFYLGMVTFFMALAVPTIASNWSVTGKNQGISLFGNPGFVQHIAGKKLYDVVLGVLTATVLAFWLLVHSRVGRRFAALKTSEALVGSLGISAYKMRIYAFILSAVPAGLAGALYVYTQQFMSAASMGTNLSINVVAACVIGGLGTWFGPVIGGAVVLGLSSFLGGLAQIEGWVFGAALIVVSIVVPEGIVGFRWAALVGAALRRVGVRVGETEAHPEDDEDAAPDDDALADVAGAVKSDHGHLELRVDGLCKAFGGTAAVKDVSLSARTSEIHAIIGTNGAGKTTVLNLIGGFYELDAGTITLEGRPLNGLSTHDTARCGIGRTFQTPKLIPNASVLDNVRLGAEQSDGARCHDISAILRLPRGRRAGRTATARALAVLRLVGIADLAEREAGETSHGHQRLIEVARAVATGANFLLLDEPAAGLSHRELAALQRAVKAVSAQGIGILLIEHNLPFVLDVADRVTVMDEGAVVVTCAPQEVSELPEVARIYIGRQETGVGNG